MIAKVFRLLGLMVVVAVNIFVLYSNFGIKSSRQLTPLEEFFQHATVNHKINISPFTLVFNMRTVPIHFMDASPSVPFTVPQFMPALVWLTIFLILLSWKMFFFGVEKMRFSLSARSVLIPPPKFSC